MTAGVQVHTHPGASCPSAPNRWPTRALSLPKMGLFFMGTPYKKECVVLSGASGRERGFRVVPGPWQRLARPQIPPASLSLCPTPTRPDSPASLSSPTPQTWFKLCSWYQPELVQTQAHKDLVFCIFKQIAGWPQICRKPLLLD